MADHTSITKRQAMREVRANADALIEQLERIAKGWDRGMYRSDTRDVDCVPHNSIRSRVRSYVSESFRLSAQFQSR